MMKSSLKILLLFLFISTFAKAQLLTTGTLTLTEGAKVSVKGNDFINEKEGLTKNAGLMVVDSNIHNKGEMDGFGVATGRFQLQGDWINDSVFVADQSTVEMLGGNELITGTKTTIFYNLNLDGTGVKRQTISSSTNFLDLNNIELATDSFVMRVLSIDVNAISRFDGFVSSLGDGFLSRNMQPFETYLFPVGSSLGTFRYRPITIYQNINSPEAYGVRMANNNPDDDGYNINAVDNSIIEVNPNFYHHIYNLDIFNNPALPLADITFFYDPLVDGSWSNLGHWNNTLWATGFDNRINEGIFREHTFTNIDNFDSRAFALVNTTDNMYIPNAFTPNGDGINEIFEIVAGDIFTEALLNIYNRWGELIYSTNDMTNLSWDGTYNGSLVPLGSYVWVLEYKLIGNVRNLRMDGHVIVSP